MLDSLPLNVPNQPAFGRETFKHEIKVLAENLAYDDIYHLNTQSVSSRSESYIISLTTRRARNGMASDTYAYSPPTFHP
jgi:hypothetical protein